MKRSRFSDSQLIGILKQAESGTPVPNLLRAIHGPRPAASLRARSPAILAYESNHCSHPSLSAKKNAA